MATSSPELPPRLEHHAAPRRPRRRRDGPRERRGVGDDAAAEADEDHRYGGQKGVAFAVPDAVARAEEAEEVGVLQGATT